MTISRRAFLEVSVASAAAAAVAGVGRVLGQPADAAAEPKAKPADPGVAPLHIDAHDPALATVKKADKPLRILVLGGTVFLGPHAVDYALARGHTVELFNRGKTNPKMFDQLKKYRGDRNSDLSALKAAIEGGARWDAVLDTCTMNPGQLTMAIELLKPAIGRYLMISTINAYAGNATPGEDETGPLGTDLVNGGDGNDLRNYGPNKALSEIEGTKLLGDRFVTVRPALIAGPRDPSDRFTYWPVRLSDASRREVLCPGPKDQPVQFIDVRDLARFMVTLVENGKSGAYNGVGPGSKMTFEEMVSQIAVAVGRQRSANPVVRPVWADGAFLMEKGVSPWADLPVWVPHEGETAGMHLRSNAKSLAAGLVCRPVGDTARDIMEWWPRELERRKVTTVYIKAKAAFDGRPEPKMADPDVPRTGLTPQREREVLTAWVRRQATPAAPAEPIGPR